MPNVWAYSDTHIGHRNICGPTLSSWDKGYRDFTSLEEMESLFIDNIWKLVKPGDKVLFGGDFLMGPDKLVNFARLWNRLPKCETIFIRGNHDDEWMLKGSNLEEVEKIIGARTYEKWRGNLGGRNFFVDHYPYRSWPEMSKGYLHLYAHCHNTLPPYGKSCDMGFDTFHDGHKKYTPYNIDELISFLDKQSHPKTDDHHIK